MKKMVSLALCGALCFSFSAIAVAAPETSAVLEDSFEIVAYDYETGT